MPGIAQRSDLVTAISDTLFNRADITSTQSDRWIQLAEAQMQRRITSRLRMGRNSAFAIATEIVAVPADFAGVIAFELNPATTTGVQKRLMAKTPEQLVSIRDGRNQLTGPPWSFAVIGSNFRFFPVPDQAYTAELEYWQRFAPLVNAADTNWVLTNHPDLYLYGALMNAGPWLFDPGSAQMYATMFQQLLADVAEQDKNEQPGGSLQLTPSNVFGWCNRA